MEMSTRPMNIGSIRYAETSRGQQYESSTSVQLFLLHYKLMHF